MRHCQRGVLRIEKFQSRWLSTRRNLGYRTQRIILLDVERLGVTRNSLIADAISSQCVSSAKWPVSKKRTSAFGMSRLNASAPAGRKNGSFLPHTARNGGLYFRK